MTTGGVPPVICDKATEVIETPMSGRPTSGTRPGRLVACARAAVAVAPLALAVAAVPAAARADFKICNDTASRIGVAIGYSDASGQPATEGWWTIASQTCEVMLRGNLPSRRIYIHAVDYDQGGGWGGDRQFCTDKTEFTISGVRDCAAYGYERAGFLEIDTGGSNQWTVRLSATNKQGGGGL